MAQKVTTVFEPNDEVKGDIARIYFYMATCYEDRATTFVGGTGQYVFNDKGTAYEPLRPWVQEMMMRWSQLDPVDSIETARNDSVFIIQGNRNPFVDYPGLEQYIWGSNMDVAFSYNNYTEPQTTGVSHLHRMVTHDDAVYSISGQRVDATSLKKGVYIRGGKKFIVK